MDPKRRRLYEWGTYARTARLEMLAAQEQVENDKRPKSDQPNHRDITELWHIYTDQCHDVGYTPTLQDFAQWISGTGEYANDPPATIYT
jgi:hypothetical protein